MASTVTELLRRRFSGGNMTHLVGAISEANAPILTGIIPNSNNYRIVIRFKYTQKSTGTYNLPFDTSSASGVNRFCILWRNSDNWTGAYINSPNYTTITSLNLDTWYNVEMGNSKLILNGNTYNRTGNGNTNTYEFQFHRGGGTKQIDYCEVYNGDVLVADFRPVIKNGVVGYWDNVRKLFFTPSNGEILIPVYNT